MSMKEEEYKSEQYESQGFYHQKKSHHKKSHNDQNKMIKIRSQKNYTSKKSRQTMMIDYTNIHTHHLFK